MTAREQILEGSLKGCISVLKTTIEFLDGEAEISDCELLDDVNMAIQEAQEALGMPSEREYGACRREP